MTNPPDELARAAAYHKCVFAVADSLSDRHGTDATFMAADYALRASGDAGDFGSTFWQDVIRAIEAAREDGGGLSVN